MLPFPFKTASEWDRVSFENGTFSGLAKVEGAKRARKVDAPRRSGSDGATLRIQRRELAELKITLVGWTETHLREMESITRTVFPNEASGQRHCPVGITHPALVFHDITVVFVSEVEGPTPKGDGTFELELKAHQWRPPTPRRLTPRPQPRPIETRPTAFQGIPQPAPTPPSQTATPRRRT